MANSAKQNSIRNIKSIPTEKPQLELVYGNNHNPFWQSSLFNEVYLQNDVPVKFKEMWEFDEAGPFYEFCNQFRNLCVELEGADLDSWSERNTINRLIKPILRMLGYSGTSTQEPWAEDEPFSVKEGGELKTYKPDLIIVNNPKELKYIERKKGDEKLQEARSAVIVPIEAKYWGRIDGRQNSAEDQKRADKRDQGDSVRSLDFDEQCLKYMEILSKDYGILTDGKTWRLYNRELSSDSYKRNFQFNLGHLMKHVNAGLDRDTRDYETFIENAKYFFHLFSKQALHSENGERKFLDDLLEYSKKYVSRVEEDLKARFVKAMAFACNGLQRASKSSSDDLTKIRNVAESHLFNILFIKHCESRNILPLKQNPEYRKISISNTIDKLEYFDPEKEEDNLNLPTLKRMFSKDFQYSPNGFELYDRLLELTKIVQKGSTDEYPTLEIKGFKESIFSREEWSFAQSFKLNNQEMIRIFFELGYCDSDVKGKKYQQIPYNFFSPRQLGSIYESFLDFKLERAVADMAFQRQQWTEVKNIDSEKIKKSGCPTVRKGQLFFTPDNEDRKITGSYYTPDELVRYIAEQTILPRIKDISSKDLLKLKVIDPAMGSGHFLSAALNLLARAYIEKSEAESPEECDITPAQAKTEVLHKCIFGVDINARAVKLAKLSLWMESASPGFPLEPLDDQLKIADSLLDKKVWTEFEREVGRFDIALMNPPYMNHKLIPQETKEALSARWPSIYNHKSDLANYFLFLPSVFLHKKGRVGVITSRYFLDADLAGGLRAEMDRNFSFDEIVNFGNVQVFEVNTLTVILVYGFPKDESKETVSVRYVDQKEDGRKFSRKKIYETDAFDVSQEIVFRDGASRLENRSRIIDEVKSKKKLEDVAFIGRGMSTGCDTVFVLDADEARELKLEKEYTVDTIKNGDVRSFHFYQDRIKTMICISGKALSSNSNCHKYLSKHRQKLEERYEAKTGKSKWYEVSVFRCKEKFLSGEEKIIFPYMATDNRFTVDSDGMITASDVGLIIPNDDYMSCEAMTALLNSGVYNLINTEVSKLKRGGYYEYVTTGISQYPMPEEIDNTSEKKLTNLYQEIVASIEKLKKRLKTKDGFEQIEGQIKYPNYLSAKSSDPDVKRIIECKKEIDDVAVTLLGLKKNKLKLAA